MALQHFTAGRLPWGRRFFLLLLCAACIQAPAQTVQHPPAAAKVSVEGSSLRVEYASGATLRGPQLAGKEIDIGQAGAPLRLRIDAVLADQGRPGIWLHEISALGADGSWQNVCSPDADGKRLAVALAGYTRADGRFVADPARRSIACTSGAQGNCLRFGYHYWTSGPKGESLLPQFQACLRMVRADYCGDGRSFTRNGVTIDLYDDAGVQFPEKNNSMPFEAGWSPQGAVCLHHPRVAANLRLDELGKQCPRLAAVSGEQCSEAWARSEGKAVLFNRSQP